jgi:hypothetical protein
MTVTPIKAATSHVKPQYWIRLESVPASQLQDTKRRRFESILSRSARFQGNGAVAGGGAATFDYVFLVTLAQKC